MSFYLMLPLALLLTLASCKKDDKVAAEFLDLTVAADNSTANVSFKGAVYSSSNKSGALSKESLQVTVAGGSATLADYSVQHTAGTAQAVITLTLNGAADGTEVLTVRPASGSSVYSADGEALAAGQSLTANLNETGLIGIWQSSGANVAPLLVNLGIDSIYANFKTDNTYLVEAFTPDGSKTSFTGTYVQTKSNVGKIYNITLTQNQPTAVISQGIFEVSGGTTTTMRYEVAQIEPSIPGVTPPTAAGGFGSTSGGALGIINIQTFVKL